MNDNNKKLLTDDELSQVTGGTRVPSSRFDDDIVPPLPGDNWSATVGEWVAPVYDPLNEFEPVRPGTYKVYGEVWEN